MGNWFKRGLGWFDRLAEWRKAWPRIKKMPDRVTDVEAQITALRNRVTNLEQRLDKPPKTPAIELVGKQRAVCEDCGVADLEVIGTTIITDPGRPERTERAPRFRCLACGLEQVIKYPK